MMVIKELTSNTCYNVYHKKEEKKIKPEFCIFLLTLCTHMCSANQVRKSEIACFRTMKKFAIFVWGS